ncbi:MAG: outer membrane lipid asymmetry maintenance protein MlaD [Candidatus Puniceispirillales bacterium]
MTRNTIETVMGAVVLLVAGGFLWLAYGITGVQSSSGTQLSAEFGKIGGLGIGDDVRISGITVGKVVSTALNEETFAATVTVSIDKRINLPADSSARIVASSLLGGNHIEILPGFEEDLLADGDRIYDTRDPVNLTDLLGKAVFSGSNSDG